MTADWRVWTGPVGGWLDWRILARLSPQAQELYGVLLEVSTPMPQVHALPAGGRGLYWGRLVQLSLAELAELAGFQHRTTVSRARRELEGAGLVAVLEPHRRGLPGGTNVYAVACGTPARRQA